MEEGWKTVYVTDELYQATIARDILENNEIKAILMNKRDSTYLVWGHISVLVSDADEQTAINLLKDLKS